MATVTTCDKCGSSFPRKKGDRYDVKLYLTTTYPRWWHVDLCDSCIEDLIKWLRSSK